MNDRQAATAEWKNLAGVCAAIGADLGFDPLWMRIGFAVSLIWNPWVTIATYAAAALVVLISRMAFPPRRAAGGAEVVPLVTPAPVTDAVPPLARAA